MKWVHSVEDRKISNGLVWPDFHYHGFGQESSELLAVKIKDRSSTDGEQNAIFKLQNAFSAENAVSAVVQSEAENMF